MPFKNAKQRGAFFAAMKAKKEGLIAPKVQAPDPMKELDKLLKDNEPIKPKKLEPPMSFEKLKKLMKPKKVF